MRLLVAADLLVVVPILAVGVASQKSASTVDFLKLGYPFVDFVAVWVGTVDVGVACLQPVVAVADCVPASHWISQEPACSLLAEVLHLVPPAAAVGTVATACFQRMCSSQLQGLVPTQNRCACGSGVRLGNLAGPQTLEQVFCCCKVFGSLK